MDRKCTGHVLMRHIFTFWRFEIEYECKLRVDGRCRRGWLSNQYEIPLSRMDHRCQLCMLPLSSPIALFKFSVLPNRDRLPFVIHSQRKFSNGTFLGRIDIRTDLVWTNGLLTFCYTVQRLLSGTVQSLHLEGQLSVHFFFRDYSPSFPFSLPADGECSPLPYSQKLP